MASYNRACRTHPVVRAFAAPLPTLAGRGGIAQPDVYHVTQECDRGRGQLVGIERITRVDRQPTAAERSLDVRHYGVAVLVLDADEGLRVDLPVEEHRVEVAGHQELALERDVELP